MKLRRLLLLCLAALAPVLAHAQAYPSKPVRIIVPFPAGGPADIFGRGLAQGMSAEFGQPVLVENVGGVGGVLGVDRAAKSAPDGYTLALNSASTLSIAPFSLSKMPYDVRKDFALITTVVRVPEVLAVHPSVPATSFAEFIAYAKANPGKINYGSAGAGSITHLAGELLKADAALDMVHVPYKGAAPAVTDLLAGQVQMGIFDVPILLQHIRAGKLRALALTSARRAGTLPDVPTTAEQGFPEVQALLFSSLLAPAATPEPVIRRINAEVVKALRAPEVEKRLTELGALPAPTSPEQFAQILKRDGDRWGKLIRERNIRAN